MEADEVMSLSEKDKAKFWDKVGIRGEDECWEWMGSKDKDCYGMFRLHGKIIHANRISWVLENGPIPIGLLVLHTCDNPPCENPKHLFLGTHKDNMQDMIGKGRDRKASGSTHYSRTNPEKLARGEKHGRFTHPEKTARGERSGNSKLTELDVLKIRKRHSEGEAQIRISEEFEISRPHVSEIINRKVWKHV